MINQMLKSIPNDEINQNHFIVFYLYGSKAALSDLKAHIGKLYSDTHFSDAENGICIHEICLLNKENLQERHDFYKEMAEQFSLEYDGFEIQLQESGSEQIQALNEFAPIFKPGEVFSWQTSDGKYIVGVYYGGRYNDLGCFFNIYNGFFDSKNLTYQQLDEVGFLYRNPVLLKIDSEKVKKIDGINKYLPQSCFFRVEIGEQSLDYLHENDLIKSDEIEDAYLNALLSMYRDGKVLYIENWEVYEYILQSGDVTATLLSEQEGVEKINSSYCFGVFGDMSMVESRLRGEQRDLVFLSDEVFK